MLVTQFEWLADGGFTDFPFAGPASTDGGSDLRGVFVDAFAAWHTEPFAWLALTGAIPGPDTWDVTLENDAGLSLSLTLKASERGPWTILSGDGEGVTASFLLSTEKLAEVDWGTGAITGGRLAPRAAGGQAGSVLNVTAGSTSLSGGVTLTAGYNMNLAPGEAATGEAGRLTAPLTLSAIAGAGEGLVPCDDPLCAAPLLSLNRITPNAHGNIVLEGDDCYFIEPQIEEGVAGLLTAAGRARMRNDCSPCCDCSDYGYLYDQVLRPLYARAGALVEELAALRDRYNALYRRYQDMVACRRVPEIELTATGMYAHVASVTVCLKNNSDEAWPALASPLSIAVSPLNAKLVPGSAEMSGHPAGKLVKHSFDKATGTMTFQVPPIPCCSTVWLAFEVMWPGTSGFTSFRVTANGELDGVAYDLAVSGDTLMTVNRG